MTEQDNQTEHLRQSLGQVRELAMYLDLPF